MLEKHSSLQGLTAADIMSRNPKTLDAETLAVEAVEWMSRQKISQIIILRDRKYAGMVHLHDLNREGLL
jgi:arabinose-5-phosphate isomerase